MRRTRDRRRNSMRNELAKQPYVGGWPSDNRMARRIERARRAEITRHEVREESPLPLDPRACGVCGEVGNPNCATEC